MARAGIVFGLILCGITFVGLVGTPAKSPAQFFSMMLGIPILFCGVVALNPHRRRLAIWVAATIAGAGAAVGAFWSMYELSVLADGGTDSDRYSLRLMVVMTSVCIAFVAICVVGFARLRRRTTRQEQEAAPTVRLPSPADTLPQTSDAASTREIA